MRTLAVVVVLSLSIAWSSQAAAKAKPEAPDKAAKAKPETPDKIAKKACAAGDYRKGVEILADLYVQTDDVTLIYNQGRCYEQNHQWVSAIDRFREYQRKGKGLTAEVTADIEKHIADCKLFMEEENARSAPPPQPPPPLLPAPTPQPPRPLAPQPTEQPLSPGTDPGSGLRTTGLVLGGVGLASLIAGVALNLKANSLADDANKTHDPSTESSQKSYKTGAIIGYGVGAAAIVTGATLYLIGRSKGTPNTSELALSPFWIPGEAGLAVSGEF